MGGAVASPWVSRLYAFSIRNTVKAMATKLTIAVRNAPKRISESLIVRISAVVEVRLAERDRDDRHDDVVDEGRDHGGHRDAHHEPDGDAEQVALVDELLELGDERLHTSLLLGRSGRRHRVVRGDRSRTWATQIAR